jgi:hypothetical protein
MYEPIGEEFIDSSEDKKMDHSSIQLNTNEEREVFVDSFLSKYLGEDKLREKDSLREKIKYKRQQLDLATKHLKLEARKRLESSGLLNKKQKQNRKKLVLNCKLKKSLRMYKLNKTQELEYSKYEKINHLWNNYVSSCLLTCVSSSKNMESGKTSLNEENVLNCLKQIDYHGEN